MLYGAHFIFPLQDGGLIVNNPCALAVHESRLLWPNQPFQCVLSLGTGRYDNARRGPATSTSLRAKISNLICSATDTEGKYPDWKALSISVNFILL